MPMDDLLNSLNSFKQGLNELSITRALKDANDQVQQIRGSELNEQKQQAALFNVAQGLVGKMGQSGAAASQIAQQAQNIYQQQTPDQMITSGVQQGNDQRVALGQQADMAVAAPQFARDNQKYASQERLMEMRQAMADKRQEEKDAAKNKISQKDMSPLSAVRDSMKSISNLHDMIDKNPGLVGPIDGNIPFRGSQFDKKFGAFKMQSEQWFNDYRHAITGAAASLPEIKSLRQATPNITDNQDVYKEKLKTMLDVGNSVIARRIAEWRAIGKDTSGLEALLQESGSQTEASMANNSPANRINGTSSRTSTTAPSHPLSKYFE